MSVWILPSMTVQQVAEWCERNRMIVTVEWATDRSGRPVPLVTAREDQFYRTDDSLPSLLRQQAD